jgi:hypothetical protein
MHGTTRACGNDFENCTCLCFSSCPTCLEANMHIEHKRACGNDFENCTCLCFSSCPTCLEANMHIETCVDPEKSELNHKQCVPQRASSRCSPAWVPLSLSRTEVLGVGNGHRLHDNVVAGSEGSYDAIGRVTVLVLCLP